MAWGGQAVAATALGRVAAPPGEGLRILAVDTSSFPDVTATVSLPTAAQQPADASKNLSVSSSGVALPATIKRLPADREPVALLLDTATGTQQAALGAQQAAAADLVHQLDPVTPVLIASSAGALRAGPGLDRQKSLAAIASLRLGGQRNWPTAMATALESLPRGTSPTVIVVSAGPSSRDSKDPAGLAADLAAHPVKMQWLSLRRNAGPVGALRSRPVILAAPSGLLGRFDSIAAQLATQYRVTFRVDQRATAAAVTLVTQAGAWTTETPLSFPSPAPVQGTNGSVPARAPSPVTHRASTAARTRTFLKRNWKFIAAGAAAALFLGMAFSVVSVSKTPPPRHRSRGNGFEATSDPPAERADETAGQRSL